MDDARRFTLLAASGEFVARHPLLFLGCGSLAAVGRALQSEALGPVATPAYVALEVAVEGARVLLFLAALGGGETSQGWAEVRRWFAGPQRKQSSGHARDESLGRCAGWGFLGFLTIALVLNGLIYLLVTQTDLLEWLNGLHPRLVLEPVALTLVLKNPTVIAFTIVFIATVVRAWVTPARPGSLRVE